jgi:hypothetical protein
VSGESTKIIIEIAKTATRPLHQAWSERAVSGVVSESSEYPDGRLYIRHLLIASRCFARKTNGLITLEIEEVES